ncbi:hypothetical protein OS493_002105 [Desmophyllum pertusum]|uniref:Uncharacterized protein n=1 Tax=Desmophyllum pertusum TaxID=174260 RepID=A0A9W9Z8A8_9CNID|nr:hypothetical protein OS493_002105 [Desmophyllum pertusum]
MSDRKAELEGKRGRLKGLIRAREKKELPLVQLPRQQKSKETDIERKKTEADELLKGIIPDDVIDGTAVSHSPLLQRSMKTEVASPGKDVTSRPYMSTEPVLYNKETQTQNAEPEEPLDEFEAFCCTKGQGDRNTARSLKMEGRTAEKKFQLLSSVMNKRNRF